MYIYCPKCNQLMQVAGSRTGSVIACPRCRQQVLVSPAPGVSQGGGQGGEESSLWHSPVVWAVPAAAVLVLVSLGLFLLLRNPGGTTSDAKGRAAPGSAPEVAVSSTEAAKANPAAPAPHQDAAGGDAEVNPARVDGSPGSDPAPVVGAAAAQPPGPGTPPAGAAAAPLTVTETPPAPAPAATVALAAASPPPPTPAAPSPSSSAPATVPAVGATYMVVPIRGVIGRDFTAGVLKAYLERAAKLKPAVIVLEVDTPGGEIAEAEEMVDTLMGAKGYRFVALVRKALSAGVAVTLVCKDIFVTEGAMIGGAVSFRIGTDGMPVQYPPDVAEKFQSIWRAICRKAADFGGHPSLLAEAMVDPGFAVTLRREGDRLLVERNGAGEVLKAQGRILTLTAREAVACGLARGIVDDAAAIGSRLGSPAWQALAGRPGVGAAERAAPLEQAPGALYDRVVPKVADLYPGGVLTDLQKRDAYKKWTDWLQQERLVGRRVQWSLSMVEASDATTPALVDRLKKRLAELKTEMSKYQETARKDASFRRLHEAESKELANVIGLLTADIRRIEAAPVWVVAACPDEPRIMVGAWCAPALKDALARVSPKSEFTLSGTVFGVRPHTMKEGTVLIVALLEQCAVGAGSGSASTPATTAPAAARSDPDVERAAAGRLNLVRAFRRNGFPDKAEAALKQILSDFPNTSVAEEARRQLKELQEEAKKAQP